MLYGGEDIAISVNQGGQMFLVLYYVHVITIIMID